MEQKNLKERQVRWIELLSQFNVKIQYKERVNNIVADALLRRPDHTINGLQEEK
jgi:hypothetical protein